MGELLQVRSADLCGDVAVGVYQLLRDAFPDDGPNEGDYYRAVGAPQTVFVLRDGLRVFAHLGLYMRDVAIGGELEEIGILGGIAVAPDQRRTGHARTLVRHAHELLRKRSIAFSILFAFEPRIYDSSGYRLMQNITRYIDEEGTTKTLVYRGSMYAELSQRPWPNELLDLRGRTV